MFIPQIRVYTVGFNKEKMLFTAEILEIPGDSSPLQSEAFSEIIGCSGIDIVDYNDDIAIIVDDQGMFSSGNPLFQVIAEDGYKLKLAGKLIFARNDYTESGVGLTSLTLDDIEILRKTLEIKLVGAVS